jgi:hypothetical protein
MNRIRLSIISILAALAVTAIATTTASAASFSVAGAASALLLETVIVTENAVLTSEGQPEIECTKITVRNGHFENGSSTATIAGIKFWGCKDNSSPTKCEINTIETKPLTATLVAGATKPNSKDEIKPTTGTEFTSFKLKNKEPESCGTTGNMKMTGKATSLEENNSNQQTTHRLGFNIRTSASELFLGEHSASLKLRGILTLTSGLPWSLLA